VEAGLLANTTAFPVTVALSGSATRPDARLLASGLCVQPTIDIAFRTFIRYMSTNTVIANIHAAFLLVFPIT